MLKTISTIFFLSIITVIFSQNSIKIREIVYIDEEFIISHDSSCTIITMEESFPPCPPRRLLFNIELLRSDNYIHIFDLSDFKVFFDTVINSISLMDCCYYKQTDSLVFIHAYCTIAEYMISGGRKFIRDDIYFDYRNLRDTLQQTLKIAFLKKETGEYHNLDLPEITVVSPQTTNDIKRRIRLDFCPCTKVKFSRETLDDTIDDLDEIYEERQQTND